MLTGFILSFITEVGDFSMDFLDAMFSDYSNSYKKLKRMQNPFLRELGKYQKLSSQEYKLEKQKFYNLLAYLQREGLVEKFKPKVKKNSYWKITNKGREKLNKLKERIKNKISRSAYKIEKDGAMKVVIFDIPEKDKRKRIWLRQSLTNLGFKKIQKSVWIGQNKLPMEFLNDLKDLKLLPCVEIFTAQKLGTVFHNR